MKKSWHWLTGPPTGGIDKTASYLYLAFSLSYSVFTGPLDSVGYPPATILLLKRN